MVLQILKRAALSLRADITRRAVIANRSPRFFDLRLLPIIFYRFSNCLFQLGYTRLARVPQYLNEIIFGVVIPAPLNIGSGFCMPHPMNIVIGASVVGENFTIYQNCTIGARSHGSNALDMPRPKVGDNVTLYTGAAAFGDIVIQDRTVLGANSVLLKSSQPGGLYVGLPALYIKSMT